MRGRREEMRPPRNEREKVENQRRWGGEAKARAGPTESLRAAEKDAIAAGDDAAERFPVTLNIMFTSSSVSEVTTQQCEDTGHNSDPYGQVFFFFLFLTRFFTEYRIISPLKKITKFSQLFYFYKP